MTKPKLTKFQIKTKIEQHNHEVRLLQIDLEEGNFKKDNLIWFKV